ncbi:hypothetical protein FB451DRAFT_203712 [Mycena latifolia]|nr:hypothetical protein FB451DRAFT_203712 [Mycena latifolia]
MSAVIPDRITPITQAQFSETYGGSLICCMIALPIYGISLLQTYMYYINYPKDSRWIKGMVALLLTIESAHTWLICHTVYHYSILSYSNPLSLFDGEWSVYTANSLGVPTCFVIQIYFARMIYLLAKKKWKLSVLIISVFLIIGQIVMGIYTTVQMFQIWDLPKLSALVYRALVPLYVIRVVSDILTAVALCLVLYDAAAHSIFRGSSKMFKTLIVYAMNRFILTTVVVIIQTSFLIAKPGSIWAMVIEFVTVHLYVNSVLATLNARNSLRKTGPHDEATSTTKYSTQNSARTDLSGGRPPVNLILGKKLGGVKIDQDTFMMSDLEENTGKNGASEHSLA